MTTIFMILDETEKTGWEDRNSKREYFAHFDSMVAVMVCDGYELKGSTERALDPREREGTQASVFRLLLVVVCGQPGLASCWMRPTIEIFILAIKGPYM